MEILFAALALLGLIMLYILKKQLDQKTQTEATLQTMTAALVKELYELNDKNQKTSADLKEFIHQKLDAMNAKNAEQQEKNGKLFLEIIQAQNQFKETLNKSLHDNLMLLNEKQETRLKLQSESSRKDFEALIKKIDEKLETISGKVDKRLKDGFENVDKTFKEIILSVTKISEAQKKIETLSSEVVSLQNVLSDKKSRGIFGEVQLNAILKSIFGEQETLYGIQYTLTDDGSRVIADAVIKAPEPVGLIAIDSKFPLENYTKLHDAENEFEKKEATRLFKQNLKKHIDDISGKYIIRGKTAEMAILFLPAEAIFAELNAYHQDLIDYAREKSVWIASPTTLMALLTTVMAIVRDIKTKEQAKKIQDELIKLSKNFGLYKQRWENLSRHMDTVNKDVKEITTTTNKISTAFERIEKVEFTEEQDLLG